MITELMDEKLLKKVKEEPQNNHWSQSPLEKVSSANVLLSGGDFALVRTKFLAPKLIRHATWRTENIGATYREMCRLADNLKLYENVVKWFYNTHLPESYEKGDFEHEDYTLWVCNHRNKAFVNLRQFPKGSYLLDMINADVILYRDDEQRISSSVESYSGDADCNDLLIPEQRTQTLEQLAKQNRIREGKVVAVTNEGDFEARFEEARPMTFLNYDDFPTLRSFDVGRDVMNRIHVADLGEKALQGILTQFRYLLGESCISYRK